MHISFEGRLAIWLAISALAGAGALELVTERAYVGWTLMALAGAGSIFLVWHHICGWLGLVWRLGMRRKMIALAGMIVCGIGFLGFAGMYFWSPRAMVARPDVPIPPLIMEKSHPNETVSRNVPLKSYYSFREKEEIANGLQELRISLGNLSQELTDHMTRIDVSYWRGHTSVGLGTNHITTFSVTDQSISDTIAAIKNLDSIINRISVSPIIGNAFLDDPNLSDEASYIMDIQHYQSITATINVPIAALSAKMMRVKSVYDETKSEKAGNAIIQEMPYLVVALRTAMAPLFEWMSGVNARADEIRKHLPPN